MFLNVEDVKTKLERTDKTVVGKLQFKKTGQIHYSPIGIGMEKADGGLYDPSVGYPHLAQLGAKWVRIQSGWARTEKTPGVYDFAWLDDMVDNILAAGCIPWMCLCYGNSLYDADAIPGSRCNGRPPVYTQEARDAWAKYVRLCTERYRGKVTYYEIWNEPDGKHCWLRGVNGKEYADFVRATATIVKEVSTDNKIIAGSMCNLVRMKRFLGENDVGVTFDNDPGIGPFFQEWIHQDVAHLVDYITFHSYIPVPERKMDELYTELRTTLDKYNPKIGIIQGETGVHSGFTRQGALNTGEWTEVGQVKYLLRRLLTDVAHGAFFTSYFTLLDMYENLSEEATEIRIEMFGRYGVLGAQFDEQGYATGSFAPKPSYTAMQCIATVMAEGVQRQKDTVQFCVTENCYWGTPDMDENSPMGERLTAYTFRRQGGDPIHLYYLASPILGFTYDGSTTLMLPEPMKRPAVLDMATGMVYEIDSDHITTYNGKQVLLRVLLRDYPMAIIDLDNTTLTIA